MKKPFIFNSENAELNLKRALQLQEAIGGEDCKVFHMKFPAVAVIPEHLVADYLQRGFDCVNS